MPQHQHMIDVYVVLVIQGICETKSSHQVTLDYGDVSFIRYNAKFHNKGGRIISLSLQACEQNLEIVVLMRRRGRSIYNSSKKRIYAENATSQYYINTLPFCKK